MAKQPVPKPHPVVTETICSLCDEEWSAHGDNPTVLDCIRLLKTKRPSYVPSPTFTWGWTCYHCGAWVGNNSPHVCTTPWPSWIYSASPNTVTTTTGIEIQTSN